MKNVVVTGAAGFLGSHLTEQLLSQGVTVYAPLRHPKSVPETIRTNPAFHMIHKDLNLLTPDDFPTDEPVDAFYHLAWNGVSPNMRNEFDIQRDNITLTMRAVELASQLRCGKWIGAGTVAEYEMCRGTIDPEKVASPNSLYGAAKVASFHMMRVSAKQKNLPWIWTILPSTFGERRDDESIISYTIRMLLQDREPVYGTLEQMWDFLYVKDVAKALYLIGEKGQAGKVYGVGSGIHKPLHAWIGSIRDAIAPQAALGIGKNQTMSVRSFSSCVDTYDLVEDTGFVSDYTFEEGIRRTAAWFEERIKRS